MEKIILFKKNKTRRILSQLLFSTALMPVFAASCAFSPNIATVQAAPYVFEDLGKPVRLPLSIEFVTTNPQGKSIAWGSLVDDERRALVGVHTDSGEVITVDLMKYGKSNANQFFKHDENTIYIYSGNPGQFFKYQVAENKLSLIGQPSKATYWMTSSYAVAPDGKIYVGTYPGTGVSVLDTKTDTVEYWTLSSDKNQAYVINPAAADNGMIYFPTGLHHAELWSYNPATKEKKQILPAAMQKSSGGTCRVWTGSDGQVYGQLGDIQFQCLPDGIVRDVTKPARVKAVQNVIGPNIARGIDGDGRLVLVNEETKQETAIPTSFETRAITLYSIGDEHNGKIYGSSLKPGHVFSFDTKTGKSENLGLLTAGKIQVYDILSHSGGLFMSSYTGSYYDFYDPDKPRSETNPRRIGRAGMLQERPIQLVPGSDGMIYSPNMPVKGQLGGALTRIDPKTFTITSWRNIVPQQSLMSVVPVPETGELVLSSSIAGGTSANPTEKEAVIALWDTKSAKSTFTAKPIPGATAYSKLVRARNGVVYGFSKGDYFAFDPAGRKVVFTGKLPDAALMPLLADEPIGADGLIYGVNRDNGAIFAINPADHSLKIIAQDKTLVRTHAISVNPDGFLYYTNGANLMRCKLQ